MQVPVRLTVLTRPSVPGGVLLGTGFSTVVLSASPFLLDLVADEYGLGLGTASLIGVAQLLGFMLGSWGAGRWLRPRRRVFVAAVVAAGVANLGSVLLPPFALLVALRLVSGTALGLITWLAWVRVFGRDKGMADIAVMGPLAGVASAPVVAVVADGGGAAAVFGLLAGLALAPLAFNRRTGATHVVPPRGQRSRPVPAAAVILVALALFTMGGSAVFSYAVVLGTDRVGLTVGALGLLFSCNAVAGIPGARWPWRRGRPGPWLALTGACAVTLATSTRPVVFGTALVLWGFAFWMAMPGVFGVLAARSAEPADRAGDAQAVMAAGRVLGPLVGGVVLDTAGPLLLGLVGGGSMVAAGAAVFFIRSTVAPRPPRPPGSPGAPPDRRSDHDVVGAPAPLPAHSGSTGHGAR